MAKPLLNILYKMSKAMTDKYKKYYGEDDEIEKSIDERKEQAIAKHMINIAVMDKLINAINDYLITFGRDSNVHDKCFDLKKQVQENKKHLQEWVDKI